MPPTLRQSAGNSIGSGQSRTCTVTLSAPTLDNNLIVAWAVTTHSGANMSAPSGYTLIRERSQGDLKLTMWYRESAPPTTSFTVTTNKDRSVQVRLLEYSGAAQSGSLDKVTVLSSNDRNCRTGNSGTTAQADSIVVAAVANKNASCGQSGFIGVLIRLIESISPQNWGYEGSDPDEYRSRLTVHHCVTTSVSSFALECFLSSVRHWIAILAVFKGGSLGPARMTSRADTVPSLFTCDNGVGSLTVFGPLRSTTTGTAGNSPMCSVDSQQARIGPYNYQYRLGGWTGLLIGDETPYEVVSHDGLEGWQLRQSDDELPRGDGSLRGVDLQTARQILFEIKTGSDLSGALNIQSDVETAMDTLYRALVPQRDADWELIFRHPGRPLRMLRCRPVDLIRELTWVQTMINEQKIALVAADPRHYSAYINTLRIVNTAAGAAPIPVSVLNEGNGFAYPTVRIAGPSSGPPVTRIELTNLTADIAFVVQAVLPKGSTLVGDMDARATGAARSVVTIDTVSKYGSWQHPRETFRLNPGDNAVHIQTTPAGAPITCDFEYRDTWSG